MKTYTKSVIETKPRLVIEYDDCPMSPREWTNLGYFITIDSNYHSPDKNEELEAVIKAGGEYANSLEEHIKYIKKHFSEKVIAIYPINKYEHSGIVYRLGTAHGWDCSNNGFYVITDKTQKEMGTAKKDFEKVIKGELDIYNQYANGEVYRFYLCDEAGEVVDSCGGIYSIDEIRDMLPDEWKNENLDEYFVK